MSVFCMGRIKKAVKRKVARAIIKSYKFGMRHDISRRTLHNAILEKRAADEQHVESTVFTQKGVYAPAASREKEPLPKAQNRHANANFQLNSAQKKRNAQRSLIRETAELPSLRLKLIRWARKNRDNMPNNFSQADLYDIVQAKALISRLRGLPKGKRPKHLGNFLEAVAKFKTVLQKRNPVILPGYKRAPNETIKSYDFTSAFRELEKQMDLISKEEPKITRRVVFGLLKDIWAPKNVKWERIPLPKE